MTPEGRYLQDFDTRDLPRYTSDVLVIGAGIAGLSAALAAADGGASVRLLAKDARERCNTAKAQGGIAVAIDPDDDPTEHASDTLRTGGGLADPAVVDLVTREAPAALEALVARGAQFDQKGPGGFDLGREGAHSHRRIVHAFGDNTGAEIMRALGAAADAHPGIRIQDDGFVLDLLTAQGRCVGALVRGATGALHVAVARAVVLAAGGAGRLYRETSNVRGATGDGIAAAYRAGATVRDMEFVQFHPTTLYLAGTDRILVTEAVRGEGARIIDNHGERFLPAMHPEGELAPRDVVSRAIVQRLQRPDVTGVFLDLRHWPHGRVAERFPGLQATCARYGIEPERDRIPVRPAAHYLVGGVAADVDGRTSLAGLYACGEASCTGLHGANRLASNSLLEGLVIGQRTGRAAAAARTTGGADLFAGEIAHRTGRPQNGRAREAGVDVEDLRKSLISRMWRSAGVLRDGAGLSDAAGAIESWRRFLSRANLYGRAGFELENLLLLGSLVVAAALRREESRGTHARLDFPELDDVRCCGSYRWTAGSEPVFVPLETIPSGGKR